MSLKRKCPNVSAQNVPESESSIATRNVAEYYAE